MKIKSINPFPKTEKEMILVSTIALVLVSGISLLCCNYFNKDHGAEEYFEQVNVLKYYALKFSYSIVAISFAFNARYLIGEVFAQFKNKIFKTMKFKL